MAIKMKPGMSNVNYFSSSFGTVSHSPLSENNGSGSLKNIYCSSTLHLRHVLKVLSLLYSHLWIKNLHQFTFIIQINKK